MRIISTLLNLLFPPRCVFCKQEGDFLCTLCVSGIQRAPIRKYEQKICSKKEFEYLDGLVYGVDYAKNPAIQAAIKQLKYRFNEDLGRFLGNQMAIRLKELSMVRGRPVILIPIPLHPRRLAERGFNQSEILSRAIQDRYQGSLDIQNGLSRIRYTSAQAKLKKRERYRNLKGAFKLNKNFVQSEGIVFLVDDVFTTGSTLENAAKTLKDAGVKKVYGLVVARAKKT